MPKIKKATSGKCENRKLKRQIMQVSIMPDDLQLLQDIAKATGTTAGRLLSRYLDDFFTANRDRLEKIKATVET